MDSTAAFEQEVRKNFRFNFTVNLLDVAAYMFAYSFMSPSAILPVYITHFTRNPTFIGLFSFLGTAGILVPQLFTANLVERAPVKKVFPFNLGFLLERLPIFLFVPTSFLFAGSYPVLALTSFFILYTWHTHGAGSIMVGWQDMIAKIIPVQSRGKFFGISNSIGNVTGILGAATVAWLLARYPFPTGFVIAFCFASVFMLLSWIFLGLSREPRDPVRKPEVSSFEYFKALPAIIRSNHNFQNYLLTQIVSSTGAVGAGFLLVYAIQRWSVSDSQAASYSIAIMVTQSIANLLLGFLADRKGHKIVLEISILLSVVSFVIALVVSSPAWFYLVFALRGIVGGGVFVSSMALPLEFSEPKDRPTYIGLASTLPGMAGAVAPLIGGALAELTGYQPLFLASALITCVAFVLMRWTVKEPRHDYPL